MAATADFYKKNADARKKRQAQQSKYNKTEKGKSLIANAKKLRKKLGIPKGSKMDAAHYKGSTTKGRPQHRSENRKSRTKKA
tara:strand:+ start:135 stop:380 length:246 start_codon:yes stop_codon:yes gene_type:complete